MPRFNINFTGVCCAVLLTISSAIQAAGNPPDAPDNLTGSIDDTALSLSWDVPDDDDTVAGYNVYINNQYATTVLTNSYSTTVDANTLYSFYVVAFDEEPRQFSSASSSLTLPESLIPDDLTIPPSVPEALGGSIDGNSVSLVWQASTDDEAVLGYNVYRDNQYLTTVSDPAYTGFNEEDESHSWYVVAFDIRTNFSARSERIVLPDQGPVDTTIAPSVPTGLAGEVDSGDTSDNVTLTWEPSTDDQSVAGYNIYLNRQYIATRFDTIYTGSVEAGSSNSYSVVAFDFDGNFSSASEALTLPVGTEEVNPGAPPSIPTNLAGDTTTSDGRTQVQLTWTASTSNVRVAGYNIYRNNDYHTTVFTNAYIDEVSAGTAFSYSVAAFDDFGNFSSRSLPLNLLGDANQPPFFSDLSDQTLSVDQPWELRLQPVDIDGGAAGILVSALPPGAELVDNGDGSRSLMWTPMFSDVGSYELTITAFDLMDTTLRTSEDIVLTVADNGPPADLPFTLAITQAAYNLQEGDAAGINVPVTLNFNDADSAAVTLSVSGSGIDDEKGITAGFSRDSLSPEENTSELNLQLAIDVLPILSSQRSFTITATSGAFSAQSSITVAVSPVARDDVYLLIGQSNMVGLSEDNAKQAEAGGADEPNLRIRQANVELNDVEKFPAAEDFTSVDVNFQLPRFVTAQDPLHDPVDPSTLSKEGTRIGMGLSLAKSALPATSRNIVLVPAAWSGSGFCDSDAPAAQWNAQPPVEPELGNTLLFDRALTRINETLQETGGILRGIVWHQGEADSNEACAQFYEQNLINMVSEFRSRIVEDERGSDARGPSADIPFVLGTMSAGMDERGDLSNFSPSKLIVDSVHRNIANIVPFSEVVLTDDLIPGNGFPCGEASCIHFGALALREMGARGYAAIVRAAGD